MNRSSFHSSVHSSWSFTHVMSPRVASVVRHFSCAAVRRSSFHHPQLLSCTSFSNAVHGIIVAHLFVPALEVSSVWGAWQPTRVSCALSRGFPCSLVCHFRFFSRHVTSITQGLCFFLSKFQDLATSSLPQQSASCEQVLWQVLPFFSSQAFLGPFMLCLCSKYCRSRN